MQQREEVGPAFIPLVECHGQQDADETLLGCLSFTGPLGVKTRLSVYGGFVHTESGSVRENNSHT